VKLGEGTKGGEKDAKRGKKTYSGFRKFGKVYLGKEKSKGVRSDRGKEKEGDRGVNPLSRKDWGYKLRVKVREASPHNIHRMESEEKS